MIRWKLFFLLFILLVANGVGAEDGATPSDAETNELFSIRKDDRSPWSQVRVSLPQRHPLYDGFVANVVDVSDNVNDDVRDINKTFISSDSPSTIRIHGLRPGHKYSIAIVGRKGDSSSLIKEESIVMEPRAPDFRNENSEININEHNITMRTIKNETYLQDSFSIEYRQINPDKKFAVLQVLDIADQKSLEFYLGNLNPGFDYSVRVTAFKDGVSSRPWMTTLTTKPSPLKELTVTQNTSSCVDVAWTYDEFSGSEYLDLQYSLQSDMGNVTNMTFPSSEKSTSICDKMTQGESYQLVAVVTKGGQKSDQLVTLFQLRPLPPIDFRVRADLKRGKYKLLAELPTSSRIETCRVTVVGDAIEKMNTDAAIEQTKSGHRVCWANLALSPGERFDFAVASTSRDAVSQKLQKSIVLTPAFDFNAFGLTLQESNGGIELLWPQSDVFIARVRDIWNKVVGAESSLNMRVVAMSTDEKTRQFESSPKTAQPVMVTSLTKGACYRVQVYTVTATGIISETQHNETIRISSPPVNVSLESVTRSSATLGLSVPSHETGSVGDCQLHLVVRDMHSQSVYDKRLPLASNFAPLLNLDGLRPFHKYTVNTQIICGGSGTVECPPATRTMRQLSFSTRQDKPGPVQALRVEPLNSNSALVSWLPPALPNGILTHYVVNVSRSDSDESRSIDVGVSTNRSDHTVQVVIDELFGGHTYSIGVRAVTEAGFGDDETSGRPTVLMPITAPPKPTIGPQVLADNIGSSTMIVRFPKSIFDNKNGEVKQFAIVVSEVTSDVATNRWLDSDNGTYTWTQAQRFDVWPSYTAKLKNVESVQEEEDVIFEEIGIDDACRELSAERICNGPLRASTSYRFRVRLFTAPNMFADSELSSIATTESVSRGVPLFWLVIALSILLLSGLVATVILCFFSRNKKARCAAYASGPSKEKESQWEALKMMMAERAADCLAKLGLDANGPSTTVDGSNGTLPNRANHLGAPGFGQHRRTRSLRERTGVEHRLERLPSGPIMRASLSTVVSGVNTNKNRPVRIENFEEHVRMMSADSDFRFSEEYELMKNVGVGQSFHASEMTVNRPKNRFTNILAYDHSRVRIGNTRDVEGGDYINANYLPGFSSKREFIAAQGPLPTTRDAFWQMTWEQQCPAIIALTKCVEKGRDKCHQYWPDAENATIVYGDIEVTLLGEKHFDEFVIRDMRLERGGKSRIVRHWHYMAWPDFGVPQHPQGIISFARMYRNHLPHSPHNMPTIVHCSAGVGRSGTFIAIDRLLQTTSLDRPIDVFGIVCEMRYERCQMVQNEQQYIFIHLCILHALSQSTQSIPSATPQMHQNAGYTHELAESGF